tara:strand:+ start:64 stop:246 length:183 start_codon:yes stop_codon:yes gene_type:complete
MIRIEDEEYGVLYLAPLCDNWYIEFDDKIKYPYFVLIEKKKILKVTRDMPECVWNKIKNA